MESNFTPRYEWLDTVDNGWPESEYLCVLGLVLFVIGRWTHLDTLNSICHVSKGQVVPDGSAHDGFGPRRRMVRPSRFSPGRRMVSPTSLKNTSVLNSVMVGLAHANSGILNGEIIRIIVLTLH